MTIIAKILSPLKAKPFTSAIALAIGIAAPAGGLALASTPVLAQSNSADLDRAITALRAITTLKADFTQTDRNGQVIGGEITLKNPGKIRFEYDKDVNMLVVANGSSLTLIDYDVQQVERWPISDSPLGALLDPKRDLKRYGSLLTSGNPDVISIAVADPKKPEYGKITLIFVKNASAPKGLELVSWIALDSQNTRTTIRLSNHRYGQAIPNSAFRFRDPRKKTRRPG